MSPIARLTDSCPSFPSILDKFAACSDEVRMRAERVRQTTRNVLPEEKAENGTVTIRQSSSWLDNLTSGAIGATEVVVIAAFIPFLVFFMLSWQDHVRSSTVMLFSPENRNTAYVTLGLISQMIRAFIVGNVVIGVILGVTSTIAFWILGVPFFYVIGMISGIVSLLPYLGIVLAIIPPVVVSMGSLTSKQLLRHRGRGRYQSRHSPERALSQNHRPPPAVESLWR